MTRKNEIRSVSDLTDGELGILKHCAETVEDAVYIIDIVTSIADLPRGLRGVWFDEKLLSPRQSAAYKQAKKDLDAALRRLFRADLIDVGREDMYPEGFKRHHQEVIAALRDGRYWRARPQYGGKTPSLRVVEDHVAAHAEWADATDLRAAQRELGGAPDFVFLTDRGREFAGMLENGDT